MTDRSFSNLHCYDYYVSMDVESVGLNGQAFAYALITYDRYGVIVSKREAVVSWQICNGTEQSFAWIKQNIPSLTLDAISHPSRESFLESFRTDVESENARKGKVVFMADCTFPVETNLISEAYPSGTNGLFYPFIDIGSVLLAAGLDPIGTYDRLPEELPAHDPSCDAMQSARLFFKALEIIRAN